jgi:heme o synthase
MLPVVASRAETKQQILIYSILLVGTSLMPWALGFAGAIYGATAALSGVAMILIALQLRRNRITDQRAARRLFAFSIFYLFVVFATLLVDSAPMRGQLV